MSWLQFISLLLLLQSAKAAKGKNPKVNYCNSICGKKHIACKNNGRIGPDCPANIAVIKLDKSTKDLILSLHNEKRNEVAGGEFNNLPPATRMAQMKWDDELARLAQIKAKRCSYSEDECHSTKKFQNPGQNIAWLQYNNETEMFTPKTLVENRIKDWFNSSSLCKMEHINKFHDGHSSPYNCDFALAVIDKNTNIGCGAIQFQIKPKQYFHLVCNYAHKIKKGEAAYKIGDRAILCKTGSDKKYPHLCSSKEKYELS